VCVKVLGRQACWPAERFSRWGASGAKGDWVAGDRDLWRSGVRWVGARGMVVGQAVVRQLASPTGPRAAGRRTRLIDRLPGVGHRADGMGKLQPAAGLWPVAVDDALTRLGSSPHRTHRLGRLSPTPVL